MPMCLSYGRRVVCVSAHSVGQIGLDLVLNKKDFEKQVGGIQRLAEKTGKMLASAFAVKKLVDFGAACIELGSDLEEVQNVVDVTFPAMSKRVDAFAQGAAEAFGLSETMAKQFTGTFGAMAKAFGFSEEAAYDMSTALTGLAGDVASFYNLDQKEAYTKLKSVFTGETESLKDLGIVMSQTALDSYALAKGFGKTTAKMTEAEKVALRYKFVQEQLAGATGDFARTSDGWANQVRILKLQFDSLKATIGQGLINALTPVIKVINTLVGKLMTLANAFKSFTEMFTGKKGTGDAAAQMQATATAADKAAASTAAVGDAAAASAKKLKGLYGFDSLNVASKDSGSSGAGGASGGYAADTFDMPELDTKEVEKASGKLAQIMEELFGRVKVIAQDFASGNFFQASKDISALAIDIFNLFSDAIDQVDWYGIGNKIGEFLAGLDWLGIIKAAVKLKFNIWKAIAEVWFGAFDAAPIETTIITAIAGLKWTGLGPVIAKGIGGAIAGKLKDIAAVFAEGGFLNNIGLVIENLFSGLTLHDSMIAVFGKIGTAVAGIGSVISGAVLAVTSFFYMWENGWSVLGEILKDIGIALSAIGAVILGAAAWPAAIVAAVVAAVSTIAIIIHDNWDAICDWFSGVGEWFDTNVITPVVGFFRGLWESVSGFFSNLWEDIVSVWDTVSTWFSDHVIEPVKNFFVGLATRIGQVFEGIWIFIQAIWKIVSDWFNENVITPVVGFFQGLWEMVSGFFSSLWEDIVSIWDTVSNWFNENVIIPVTGFFQGLWEAVSGFFINLWEDIRGIWNTVSNWFNDTIITPVQEAFETACDAIGGFFTGLWDGIKAGVTGAINAVIGAIEGAINWIVGGINKIIQGFNDVVSWAADVIGADWGGVGLVPEVSIPRLAEGGYVKANTPQLAMIGDNRHQGEVVAPEDKLYQVSAQAMWDVMQKFMAAMKAMAGSSGNGGTTIVLKVTGEMAPLVRMLKMELDKERSRSGINLEVVYE